MTNFHRCLMVFPHFQRQDLISIIDKSIVNLELPDSLTLIGDYAFYNCMPVLPAHLFPSIPYKYQHYAFSNCTSLALTSLPGVTSIGNYAFQAVPILPSQVLQVSALIHFMAVPILPSLFQQVLQVSELMHFSGLYLINRCYFSRNSDKHLNLHFRGCT